MTAEDAPKISDAIMSALLQMFSSTTGKSGGVQEDALMAVSMLVEGISYFWFVTVLQSACFHTSTLTVSNVRISLH